MHIYSRGSREALLTIALLHLLEVKLQISHLRGQASDKRVTIRL